MQPAKYIGPDLKMITDPKHRDPLKHGEAGVVTSTKRGGLVSFLRDRDNRGFWVRPDHVEKI